MTEHIVADSGARESFTSGMVRDTREGKGRFDLITPVALRRLALVYERGAAKYTARNWEKGSVLSRFADSAQRHLNDYQMIALYKREGIPLDRLPGDVNPHEDHLAQAVWNLCCIMHHEDLHPELDDLSARPVAPIGLESIKPGMAPEIRAECANEVRKIMNELGRGLGCPTPEEFSPEELHREMKIAKAWGLAFTQHVTTYPVPDSHI